MDILEALKHFEDHQNTLDDRYGAEVLSAAQREIRDLRKKIFGRKNPSVYRMSEHDWWADYSLQEAKDHYVAYCKEEIGIGDGEIETKEVHELSETELKQHTFFLDEGGTSKVDANTITFKQQLRRMARKGNVPGFFASTEY